MIKNFITCSAAIGLCSTGVLAGAGIERIAPEETLLLLRIDNMAQTVERAKVSGFADIWNAPELEDTRTEFLQMFEDGLEQFFAELGVDDAELKTPTGPVGIALYLTAREDADGKQVGAIAMADFGDDAAAMDEIVRALLDQGRVEVDLTWDEVDIRGREVLAIDLPDEEEPIEENEDEFGGMGGMGPDWEAILGTPSAIYYVRDGSRLYLCTDVDALDGALSVADGEDIDAVGARDDYNALSAMIGDNDVAAMLLTEGLGELLMQDMQMAMGLGMMSPVLETLFGKIDGFAYGVSLDHPVAMMEINNALLLMDGKAGLFELADTNVPRGSVPPFVSRDATSYMTANIEFGEVMDLIRQVIGAAPPMVAGQVEEGFAQVQDDLSAFFGSLGTTIYSTSTIQRPITMDSEKSLLAFECTNPKAMEDLLDKYGEQMGLESRDFLGQRIYTSEFPLLPMGGMPGMMGGGGGGMSIGLGAGAMFVGSTSAVEQVLRDAGEGGGDTLDDNPQFVTAIGALDGDDAVAWGYSNLVDQLDYTINSTRAQQKEMLEQIREFDPEAADEMAADIEDADLMFGLDPEFLRRYLGPTVWQLRATDEGFVGQAFVMPSSEQEG